MTATTLPVGLIVQVGRVVNDEVVLVAICPFCGEPDAHRARLAPADSPIRASGCRQGEYTLKVHRELAAGRRWEPGDPEADDEDEREPRWVD